MRNLLLLLAVIALSAMGVEAGMRAAGFVPRVVHISPFFIQGVNTTWSEPDIELGWINKAGVAEAIGSDHPTPMTFWDFSRRASRPAPAIPAGVRLPVMVVGGSDAQSYGVRDEESFITILAQRYPNFWFENFGTGGYSTVQALMLAERAYDKFYTREKPRLLLLTFSGSHVDRNVADQSWISAISDSEGRYIAPPHYVLRGDKMVFHPFRTISYWPLEKRSAALTTLHNVWLKSVVYNTATQGPEVTRRIIARFAEFAAQRNMVFAVVVTEDYRQIAQTLFSGQSFPHKDCSGLERTDPKAYIFVGNNHPNAKLHAYFAECMSPWLDTDVLPSILPASVHP
jgi:hypothetical protein